MIKNSFTYTIILMQILKLGAVDPETCYDECTDKNVIHIYFNIIFK